MAKLEAMLRTNDREESFVHPTKAEDVEEERIGVLVAEDDAMFRRILQSWLESWGFWVVLAEDGVKAWEILQQKQPPELLILDWMMPGIDGTELCRRIRARHQELYQYILLATSKDEKQDVVQGFEAGADDYLTKPFNRNELRARLRVGRRILTLQKDLIRAREDLRFQATHDVLTGLWNRRALLDLFESELDRASRAQSSTGVLMLDLDHFKQVNDTHGHLVGDAVLTEAVRRMNLAVRSYDVVGRYGGEEFLIVLPDCDSDQIFASAERVRTAIHATPVKVGNLSIPVTISIGAAIAAPNGADEKAILAVADNALYKAKHAGRNCVIML
jgi:diguanylate cyclase (GGDEF)-like protein